METFRGETFRRGSGGYFALLARQDLKIDEM